MDKVVQFYEGGVDHAGRTLEEIMSWNDERLESVHDYIQWVFPNRAPSRFNAHAPLVTDSTVRHFRLSPALREKVGQCADRMALFYAEPWWTFPGDHNHLRITRILHALRELGPPCSADDFHAKVLMVYRTARPGPIDRTQSFWWEAVKG